MAEGNVTCNLQMEKETLQAVFWIPCKCSMRQPFVMWQMSSWQFISAHTHCSMGRSCGRDCIKAGVLNTFP